MAKVVLDNPSTVARRSITEVADAAGTSETTVTRFCKAIGVGGYPELRIALAALAVGWAALPAAAQTPTGTGQQKSTTGTPTQTTGGGTTASSTTH